MLHDEASSDGSAYGDGNEPDGKAGAVVVGIGGEVSGFSFVELLVGEDLDTTDEVGHGDIEPVGAGCLAAGDLDRGVDRPKRDVGFGILDGELEGGAVDGVGAGAVAVHAGNRRDVAELEDEVGLVGGADELEVSPGLQGSVHAVVGVLSGDGEVCVGAVVDEEYCAGCSDLGRNGRLRWDGDFRRGRGLRGLGGRGYLMNGGGAGALVKEDGEGKNSCDRAQSTMEGSTSCRFHGRAYMGWLLANVHAN